MIKNFFWHLFSDKSPLNPTQVVGFLAFMVMAGFALADVGTGLFGKELVISNIVYESFTVIVGGAFLGGAVNSAIGNKNVTEKQD